MKTIAFVVVWAGRLPDYFKLWLNSCSYNPTVDFLIFTDDRSCYEIPENVKIITVTFEELKKRFQKNFEFPIRLERAYKLCDYKPAYGEVFQEYLKEYDFWGYCDLDLIWGDIRSFLTDEILEQYERIFTRGHCSLFLNQERVNAYYRTLPAKGHLTCEMVYQSDESWCFDEWGEHCGGGISVIFKENQIATYDKPVMADLWIQSGNFLVNRRPDLGKVECFSFEKGKLYACGNQIKSGRAEVLYCHFQKRKVVIEEQLNMDQFYFLPPGKMTNSGVKTHRLERALSVWKCNLIWKLKKVWSRILSGKKN